MKKLGFVFLASLLFSACTGDRPQESRPEVISLRAGKGVCTPEVRYLRLRVPPEVMIGRIEQFGHTDRFLFVLQSESKYRGLYVFTTEGEFVAKIGNFGRGQGEYVLPLTFTLGKQAITVIDGGQNRALHYDTATFRFLGSDPIFNTSYFEWIDEGRMLCVNDEIEASGPFHRKQYVTADARFAPEAGLLDKILLNAYVTGPSRPMYTFAGKVRAFNQQLPYIYEFREEELVPVYEIEFDRKQLPPLDYLQRIAGNGEDYYDELTGSGYVSYYNFFETADNRLIYYILDHKKYVGLCTRGDKRTEVVPWPDFRKRLGAEFETVTGVWKEWFVAPIAASELKRTDGLPAALQRLAAQSAENEVILALFNWTIRD